MGRLALAAFVICASASSASAQKLTITAQTDASGDGSTAIAVRVELSPATAIDDAEGLALVADGGTVGAASPDGDAAVVYQFVPPRVASDTKVTLRATVTIGRKKVRAKHTLTVKPLALEQAEVASGGPFDLRVPDRMLLGAHDSADVSIAAPDGAPPRIETNVGTISALSVGDDGRLHATYTPPKAKFPQVAIIAVIAMDSADVDWATIALHGKATVELKSEANASVLVRVGDVDYGPVNTDRRGKADVVVTVPPGIAKAKTIATDSLGNVKRGSLALGAPPFGRLLAICPVVDSRFRVLVLDSAARPAKRAKLELTASVGAFDRSKNVAPGVFVADYNAPDGATIGDEVTMSAAIAGADSAKCDAVMPGEVPSAVEVTLERTTFAVGGEPLGVAVSLVYPGRLPPLDVGVSLRAELGEVSELVPGDDGRLSAVWTLPDHFKGLQRAELAAEMDSSPATAKVGVALVAGAAVRIVAAAGSTAIRADGADTTTIVVRAFDAHDNLQPELELTGKASGTVGAFERQDDGTHIATYTSVRSTSARVDIVTVTSAGGISADARVGLRPLPHRFAASARVGYVTNFAKVSGPMLAIGGSTRLPVLRNNLDVGLEVELYRSRTSQMDAGGNEQITTVVDAIPIQVTARLSWELGRATPYVVGRAGLAMIDAGVESASTGKVVRSETTFAVSGGVGADVAVGPGSAVFELAMLRAALGSAQVSGNAGGLQIGAGYRIGF